MATRTQLRESETSSFEEHHGLLDWAEETGLAPEEAPGEGVPWHLAFLLVAALLLLIAVEITLTLGVAKLVTGHAY